MLESGRRAREVHRLLGAVPRAFQRVDAADRADRHIDRVVDIAVLRKLGTEDSCVRLNVMFVCLRLDRHAERSRDRNAAGTVPLKRCVRVCCENTYAIGDVRRAVCQPCAFYGVSVDIKVNGGTEIFGSRAG